MYDRNCGTGCELGDAADIAGCDQIGVGGRYVGQLAIPQRGSELRLQDVVGPRRAAAEMPFRHVQRLEPGRRKEPLWPRVYPLSVLHRAGGMVGDTPVLRSDDAWICAETESLDDLGDVARERSDTRRLLRVNMVLAQHKAVILHHGAAARGVDHDGV